MRKKLGGAGLLIVAVTALCNVSAVIGLRGTVTPPDAPFLRSVSFSPNARGANPEKGDVPGVSRIASDLDLAASVTGHVRTYTVSQNMDLVPELASARGLTVSLGTWVDDHDPARTKREFESAVGLARHWSSVTEVLVGNEAVLRHDATPAEIAVLMRRMHAETGLPVSTGETWDNWIKHPEMAAAADFIAAHVLPYWEGIPARDAARVAIERYHALERAYPGKRIQIAEFGWPSAKFNRGAAHSGLLEEAAAVRSFAAQADRLGIDYNVVELVDQPWKTKEGDVGAHWGLFDASRDAKFPLTGSVEGDPLAPWRAAGGALFGAMLAYPFACRRRSGIGQAVAVATAAQVVSFGAALVAAEPFRGYLDLGTTLAWVGGLPLSLLLGFTVFDRLREMADSLLGSPSAAALPARVPGYAPLVSIHVPACRERPDVVIRTLEALAALDYPNFEVLAVVNNTPDHAMKLPIMEACERLGARFKYVDLPRVSGFKAGALNAALAYTSPDAEVIGVVDADYTVSSNWLSDLVPAFADPAIALVQAPQAHRDGRADWLRRGYDNEYWTFFSVGMVERARDNAIIAHGTMVLVRRAAFEAVGRWDAAHICEDTELGLRLLEKGWKSYYTPHAYGFGLLPDTLHSFRRQRDRWAYGAVRIAAAHWRSLLPWNSSLTAAQKYHFTAGWMHWAGDAAAAVLGVANIGWAVWMLVSGKGEPPPACLTWATVAAAIAAVCHLMVLHPARVGRGLAEAGMAAVTGAALQLTVAKAVLTGLLLDNLPFVVTAKGGKGATSMSRYLRSFGPELTLGGGLMGAAIALHATNTQGVTAVDMFAAVLAIQALPSLSAFAMGTTEVLSLSESLGKAVSARVPAMSALFGIRRITSGLV